MVSEPPPPLLELVDVTTRFRLPGGGVLTAVDRASLTLLPGRTLAVVGESGCGKSTLARTALRLIEPESGTIRFMGEDLRALRPRALRARRRLMQLVFQDPLASLDPRMRVGALIEEPLIIHELGFREERRRHVAAVLERVGLPPETARRFPHELSGGQRQRVGIARAIVMAPRLIVLDEPVSALDVSIQAQILNLLDELKRQLGLSYLLISHDLGVVRHVADEVAVMYLGRIVEQGPVAEVFATPAHPYTAALLASVPDPLRAGKRLVLEGEPPSPEQPPPGCPFHPRCPRAFAACATTEPVPIEVAPGRRARCLLYPKAA
jgi:oligopeptide/dipeptide ABC transporter ATP-binding protein